MNEGSQEWQEVSREEGKRHYGRGVDRVVFRLPNGKETDFSIFSGGKSIACLAMTNDKRVILAQQFRPGPKKVLMELPGGGLKEGESVEEAMGRELLEETGYQGKVQFVAELLHDGYSPRIKYALVAIDCIKVSEPQLEDNGEKIVPVLMTLAGFREHLRSGQLTDIEVGYLGLDFLNFL